LVRLKDEQEFQRDEKRAERGIKEILKELKIEELRLYKLKERAKNILGEQTPREYSESVHKDKGMIYNMADAMHHFLVDLKLIINTLSGDATGLEHQVRHIFDHLGMVGFDEFWRKFQDDSTHMVREIDEYNNYWREVKGKKAVKVVGINFFNKIDFSKRRVLEEVDRILRLEEDVKEDLWKVYHYIHHLTFRRSVLRSRV
jgi:hypothetical protein